VIHTLTPNPALDITYQVPDFVFDDTVRASTVLRAPGGKGINVSRVAARLGHATVAMGFAGGRAGDELEELLEAERVRTWFTHVHGATRTNAIVQDARGRQLRVSAPGEEVEAHHIATLLASLFDLRAPEVLALSGSLLPEMPPGFLHDVIDRASSDGVRVAVDADGDELARSVEAGVYLVKPNRYELERLTGETVATVDDAVAAARRVAERGVTVVLASLGALGAVLVEGGVALHAQAPRVPVDSAVGAGDALLAGALVALVEGRGREEALRLGVACGTATAMTPGTALCNVEDVETLLPHVKVRQV